MKKNQIVIIGIVLSVILLFFMIIYRSSNGKDYAGDTQISIRVENGIKLPKVYLDSLLTLVALYDIDGTLYTQSTVSVFKSETDSVNISCPVSGMNQFRRIFSNNFYTYTERESDLRNMQLNPALYVEGFSNTCTLNDAKVIRVHCSMDSTTGGGHKAEWSVNTIKTMVLNQLKANSAGGRYIRIYFTTGIGVTTEPASGVSGVSVNPPGGTPPPGGNPPADLCKSSAVDAQFSFEKGLPNVFSWNEQEGFTYDFSLSCKRGDCETSLSKNMSNVGGGVVEVEASYAQATEKEYLATLTVRCNGKVVKTITKIVQLVCA